MLDAMIEDFTWEKYGKRLKQKIFSPNAVGSFKEDLSENRALRYASAEIGAIERGARIRWHWLVDLEDGIIIDARYELFGPSIMVALLEASVELIVGKNYDQAGRINQELLDRHLRDLSEKSSLPKEAAAYCHLVLDAIELTANQCLDISLPIHYQTSPIPEHVLVSEGGVADWPEMNDAAKLSLVQAIIERDIRPYVEMDAGGVEAIRIEKGSEVIIAYSGSCNGCHSSTGSTLSSIQAILRAKVHPSIEVTPEL
jgi:NifU-like protein